MQDNMTESLVTDWLRECSVCYSRGREADFITCDGCRAMIYCCKGCQLKDLTPDDTTSSSHCHQIWCYPMKQYMAREKELCDLPFTFIKDTTDRLFHEGRVMEFLKQHGIYGKGLWMRESPLLHRMHPIRKYGYYTDTEEEKWVLPEESSILKSSPSKPPANPLVSWHQYYIFRGLPMQSPVASILTYPLTLYYIITFCLRNDEPDVFKNLVEGSTIIIYLLGVEKEVEMKEAFLECARLLPTIKLQITMFGKQLSKSVQKFYWEKENLCISVCRALYHEVNMPCPHVAVGFNAGLSVYLTWPATIMKLKEQEIPAYFTDQSEFSCASASSALKSLGICVASPATVNPFRSPLRIVTREQCMPWYSNAFLFKLVYARKE